MILEGEELRQVLAVTANRIELRNEHGRCCRFVSSAEAADLDLELFVGIGNRRRVRFLRPRTPQYRLNSGSITTQRIKGPDAKRIAHPLIREHRIVPGYTEL